MPQTTVNIQGGYWSASTSTANNGDSLEIFPGGEYPSVLELQTVVHSGSVDIIYYNDIDEDGVYEIESTIDSFNGSGADFSQEIRVGEEFNEYIEIVNKAAGEIDIAASGVAIARDTVA